MDVDPLVRRAVQLGVLLGGGHQGGNSGRGVLDLVHEQLGFDRVVQPADGTLTYRVGDAARDLLQPGQVQTSLDEGRGEIPSAGDTVIVEPVGDRVLPVAGLQRSQRGCLRDPLHRLLLQPDQDSQGGPVVRARGDQSEFVPHPGDPFPQRRGRPYRGGGRVVQLVGEPGGQRAQRQQPLPLTDRLLGGPHAEEQPLQHVYGHREPLPHQPRQRVRREHEEARRLTDPQRGGVDLRDAVAQVGLKGTRVHTALGRAADLHVVGADPPRQHQRSLDEHIEAAGRLAFGVHRS